MYAQFNANADYSNQVFVCIYVKNEAIKHVRFSSLPFKKQKILKKKKKLTSKDDQEKDHFFTTK